MPSSPMAGPGLEMWPPQPGCVLQCAVVLAAGAVNWSCSDGESVPYGPHNFRSRKLLALADLPSSGLVLLGHRDFPASVCDTKPDRFQPAFVTWHMHIAAAGEGRLRVYLQCASTLRFLCSDDAGLVKTSGEQSRECLWEIPVAALRPISGLPCRLRSFAHEHHLSVGATSDEKAKKKPEQACKDNSDTARGTPEKRSVPVLQTTRDRRAACELVFNGLLAGPCPPQLWGWNPRSGRHECIVLLCLLFFP